MEKSEVGIDIITRIPIEDMIKSFVLLKQYVPVASIFQNGLTNNTAECSLIQKKLDSIIKILKKSLDSSFKINIYILKNEINEWRDKEQVLCNLNKKLLGYKDRIDELMRCKNMIGGKGAIDDINSVSEKIEDLKKKRIEIQKQIKSVFDSKVYFKEFHEYVADELREKCQKDELEMRYDKKKNSKHESIINSKMSNYLAKEYERLEIRLEKMKQNQELELDCVDRQIQNSTEENEMMKGEIKELERKLELYDEKIENHRQMEEDYRKLTREYKAATLIQMWWRRLQKTRSKSKRSKKKRIKKKAQ